MNDILKQILTPVNESLTALGDAGEDLYALYEDLRGPDNQSWVDTGYIVYKHVRGEVESDSKSEMALGGVGEDVFVLREELRFPDPSDSYVAPIELFTDLNPTVEKQKFRPSANDGTVDRLYALSKSDVSRTKFLVDSTNIVYEHFYGVEVADSEPADCSLEPQLMAFQLDPLIPSTSGYKAEELLPQNWLPQDSILIDQVLPDFLYRRETSNYCSSFWRDTIIRSSERSIPENRDQILFSPESSSSFIENRVAFIKANRSIFERGDLVVRVNQDDLNAAADLLRALHQNQVDVTKIPLQIMTGEGEASLAIVLPDRDLEQPLQITVSEEFVFLMQVQDFVFENKDRITSGYMLDRLDPVDLKQAGVNVRNQGGSQKVQRQYISGKKYMEIEGQPYPVSREGEQQFVYIQGHKIEVKSHLGIDFGYEMGEDLPAIASGVVIKKTNNDIIPEGLGNSITIGSPGGVGDGDDYSGMHVVMGHLEGFCEFGNPECSYDIVVGTELVEGAMVGFAGSTGNSTGVHLHMELVGSDGKKLNPEDPIHREYFRTYVNGFQTDSFLQSQLAVQTCEPETVIETDY